MCNIGKWFWYEGLTIAEYLQNSWYFFYYKREKNYNKFCEMDDLVHYNFLGLCVDWPVFFPDVMFVYKKIAVDDEHFNPGAPANERNFFNKLCYFGQKINKKKVKKITHVNIF